MIEISPVILIDGLRASVGIIFGLSALIIYWNMSNREKIALSSFQLNKKEILQDYRIIMYSNLLMVAALTLHVLSSLGLVSMLLAKILRTMYIIAIIFVLIRWVRNFK